MALSTKDFNTLVKDQATAIQATAGRLINLTKGSILRAVVEANAALVLWMQSMILQLLKLTRASTSTGGDLDTWVRDYGLTRLPAIAATGLVTLSRVTTTPGSPRAIIHATSTPARFQTSQSSIKFFVTVDQTHEDWSNADGGYILEQGLASIDVPVQAEISGVAGNVAADSIDTINTSIPGVDLVTNSAPFTNGRDAELDPALRLRFIAFIFSLARATKVAIGFAVASVRQGLDYTITENKVYTSAATPEASAAADVGAFYVVFDDGSGAPSDDLKTAIEGAVDLYRPITVRAAVFKVSVVQVDVSCIVDALDGYIHSALQTTIRDAITVYVNSTKIGARLSYTGLVAAIRNSSQGIKNVTGVTLNGVSTATDITVTLKQVIRADSVAVTVNS